jgi:hypothetical protein
LTSISFEKRGEQNISYIYILFILSVSYNPKLLKHKKDRNIRKEKKQAFAGNIGP